MQKTFAGECRSRQSEPVSAGQYPNRGGKGGFAPWTRIEARGGWPAPLAPGPDRPSRGSVLHPWRGIAFESGGRTECP